MGLKNRCPIKLFWDYIKGKAQKLEGEYREVENVYNVFWWGESKDSRFNHMQNFEVYLYGPSSWAKGQKTNSYS